MNPVRQMADGCVLWDWNGTLLDDTRASLAALNAMLSRRGLPAVTMDFYRENFAFPVKPFYVRVGLPVVEGPQWEAMAAEYHRLYGEQPRRLNAAAVASLVAVKSAGAGQCVISALRQDLLEAELDRFGIRGEFDCVYGSDNLDGAGKIGRARQLLAVLTERCGLDPRRAVMIGDAVHDAEVARALGIKCVLAGCGGHALHRLEEAAKALAPAGREIVAVADLPQAVAAALSGIAAAKMI